MTSVKRKYCFVKTCSNTTMKFPDKKFFTVPQGNKAAWCKAAGFDRVPGRGGLFICEDHLILEEDMENYMYWKTMNIKARLKPRVPTRKGAFPVRRGEVPVKKGEVPVKKQRVSCQCCPPSPSQEETESLPQQSPSPNSKLASKNADEGTNDDNALNFVEVKTEFCLSESNSSDTTDLSCDEDNALSSGQSKTDSPATVKQEQKCNSDTEDKTANVSQKREELVRREDNARYIGHQIKDINDQQLTICQRIISDTIFFAKLNKLNEYSHVVTPPVPASTCSPPSQDSRPDHSLLRQQSASTTSTEDFENTVVVKTEIPYS